MEDGDYDRIAIAVREACDDTPPSGLLLHVAGPVEGGYRYLDLWESEDAWRRFHDDMLHPALERIGVLPLAASRIAVHQEALDDVRDVWGSLPLSA
ncbi:MAG: hypothetical protein OEV72_10800 [Thermoleophilia bacterium]|nr:hypothetical protein [Thermoleophilia bacterium]